MSFAGLSDSGLLVLALVLLAVPVAALVTLNIYLKKKKPTYNWKPDQDYDVKLRGESFMQPPFPVLKKRDKPKD